MAIAYRRLLAGTGASTHRRCLCSSSASAPYLRLLRAARGGSPHAATGPRIRPGPGPGPVAAGPAADADPPSRLEPRGKDANGDVPPLPCFPLRREHFGILAGYNGRTQSAGSGSSGSRVSGSLPPTSSPSSSSSSDAAESQSTTSSATPADFHSALIHRIDSARRRVYLASLYVGAAGLGSAVAPREVELLDAIEDAVARSELGLDVVDGNVDDSWREGRRLEVKILMDSNRALRKVPSPSSSSSLSGTTSSAEAVRDRFRRGRARANKRRRSEIGNVAEGGNDKLNSKFNNDEECRGGGSGLYLFDALSARILPSILPSPLNEAAGVFHLKAYVIDDALILSGANLSEEYFTDRQDRYVLFEKGAGGLVDFYADLIEVLCEYTDRFDDDDGDEGKEGRRGKYGRLWPRPSLLAAGPSAEERRGRLVDSLSLLFDGTTTCGDGRNDDHRNNNNNGGNNDCNNIVAYAVPTFQAPKRFGALPFPSDVSVTRNLLLAALEVDPTASVRISCAYLNPTPTLMSALRKFGRDDADCGDHCTSPKNSSGERERECGGGGGAAYLLTAGPSSHGFAPKKRRSKDKDGDGEARASSGGEGRFQQLRREYWVPTAFRELAQEAASHIIPRGGNVLLYRRVGWTFHSKGLWLTSSSSSSPTPPDPASNTEDARKSSFAIDDPSSLDATIVGSGNYGARSEALDFESNCILVFTPRQRGGSWSKDACSTTKDAATSASSSADDSSLCEVRAMMCREWNDLCAYASELEMEQDVWERRDQGAVDVSLRAALPMIKHFL